MIGLIKNILGFLVLDSIFIILIIAMISYAVTQGEYQSDQEMIEKFYENYDDFVYLSNEFNNLEIK